jgi:hypothetical protein
LWGCHTPAKKTQERGPISLDRNPNAGIAERVTNWDYYEKLRSKNIVKNVFLINSICPITVNIFGPFVSQENSNLPSPARQQFPEKKFSRGPKT